MVHSVRVFVYRVNHIDGGAYTWCVSRTTPDPPMTNNPRQYQVTGDNLNEKEFSFDLLTTQAGDVKRNCDQCTSINR